MAPQFEKAASSYSSSNPNFYVGMKRLVPTGPNPEQSPESPPSRPLLKKATSSDGSSNPNYYVGMKRLVQARQIENKSSHHRLIPREEAASSDGLSNPSYYVGKRLVQRGQIENKVESPPSSHGEATLMVRQILAIMWD
ncbi:hypothetical protein FNV43_RR05653 [Rhamnella rubrinervis]|uniref:Uncharacterized protein n=1 Tax=Rhamnella rubrinervis TaxID=2594499 RepID=A0A8K0HP71_9ROSA|nr:hypothetical protein FNV43_RR05653 [Rhamnella rubrinervis]